MGKKIKRIEFDPPDHPPAAQDGEPKPLRPWYRKTQIQVAIVTGIFVMIAAIITGYCTYFDPRSSPEPHTETPTHPPTIVPPASQAAAAIQQSDTVESLRSQHAVRALAPAESELRVEQAPRGTYGFVSGFLKGEAAPSVRLYRKPRADLFEVHKLQNGDVMIVGFVGSETARAISLDQPHQGLKFVLYSSQWQEAPEVVAIPLDSVKFSDYPRGVEPDDTHSVSALDCEMK